MTKRAFITGVTGQDGSYLSRLLLDKGYEVYGGSRRTSVKNTWRLQDLGIVDDVELVPFELLEESNVRQTVEEIDPDEVYNLAAQSFVGTSFDQPVYTSDVNALGTLRLLEAIRDVDQDIRFYQASSSEMFGKAEETPQSEETPFHPRSPYGVSKVFGHWATVNYREAYDMHATSGICFNHESPLRGTQFVTRKITLALARIREGEQEVLELGNLDAQRDWGFAGDYVEAMWEMVQRDEPDDYVISTGETHSVRDFVEAGGEALGFDIRWKGEGVDEVGIDAETGDEIVRVNPEFYRPADVHQLQGEPTKAREELDWTPSHSLADLVELMVERDLERIRQGEAVF